MQLLGKKGAVTGLLKGLGTLSPEERPAAGAEINQLKEVIGEALLSGKDALRKHWREQKRVQLTLRCLAVRSNEVPCTQSLVCCGDEGFFTSVGYEVVEGPEIEDDYHNFEALNIPQHHPARAMHDTFLVSTRCC